MTDTNGTTAPGFEAVRDAFDANFAKDLEIGASFSAYHRGEKVVDLWGGVADAERKRPWDENTLALVFSTTKGATAVCANKLAQEGALDVDVPVAKYWPEFAAGGKSEIPVSYLLSHQAGLAWIDGRDVARPGAVVGSRSSTCSRNRYRTGSRVRSTATTRSPTDSSSVK